MSPFDPMEPVEVLDAEAWETPDSLSAGEWRMESGMDGLCGRRFAEGEGEEGGRAGGRRDNRWPRGGGCGAGFTSFWSARGCGCC